MGISQAFEIEENVVKIVKSCGSIDFVKEVGDDVGVIVIGLCGPCEESD